MSTPAPFSVVDARLVDEGRVLAGSHLRVADGRITAIGGPEVVVDGDPVVDGRGATLLPGLVDAHVHLLPGCTQLAAAYGVTTLVDQFSKPEVIDPERNAVDLAAAGSGPVRADFRTSSIGATAPGGHPTMAYAPLPSVTGPADAGPFVVARVAEGATHLKVIHDDGSGVRLDIPTLTADTVTALVAAAHEHRLPVVAHVSTAAGAVLVARCGVDVLAHAPFDRMSADQVREVAAAGVALVATLSVLDGWPDDTGTMPLLTRPALAARLTPRWRAVLAAQARRWLPPAPDAEALHANTLALYAAGVPVLAGTDAPNPGLVFGASLHRELEHLVAAGLSPGAALVAATSAPARVFGLADRGRLQVGLRADLVLVDGDPTVDVAATQQVRRTWVAGREVDVAAYAGSAAEQATLDALQAVTDKILAAIRATWPDLLGDYST